MATKGIELASAYVSLSVSTDDIPKQVDAAFSKAGNSADTAGRRMGRDMSSAMSGEMSKGGAKAGDAAGRSAAKQVSGHGRTAGRDFTAAMRSGMSQSHVVGWFSDFKRDAVKSGNVAGFAAGRAMGASITAGLAAATAGVTAIVGGIGYTLFKGFDRYKSLDATAKRLGAMGKTAEEVKSIVADINSVVEGTPIALDAAAKSATQFLQGGVKEGGELKSVLTAIADASGASGTSFDELAIIFGQVMNKGKLNAEEMMQLNERGIGIQAALRKEFGWTSEELDKLSRDGAITFQQLIQAVEGSFGGMAKRAGDTIDGALSNMQAAVGRVGANFIAAIFGDPLSTTEGPGAMVEAINNVTARLEGVNQWVIAHQGEIKQFFTDAADVAKTLAGAVSDVGGFLREHPDLIMATVVAFGAWKTIEGVAGLITSLKTVSSLLSVTIPASAAAAGGSLSALAAPLAAAVAGAYTLNDLFDVNKDDFDPTKSSWGHILFGPGYDKVFGNGGGPTGTASGGAGGSASAPRGTPLNPMDILSGGATTQNPLDVISGQSSSYGLPAGTDTGGYGTGSAKTFPPWVMQIAEKFGIKPSTYAGHQESNRSEAGFAPNPQGLNRGIDWSGPVENMQRFADYVKTVPGMEQVIWQNPNTGQQVGVAGGHGVGSDYYADAWGGHQNHVHTRQSTPIPIPKFDDGGWWPNGGLGMNTTGKPELVLSPQDIEYLKQQGIDPNSLQQGGPPPVNPNTTAHGTGAGMAPGPGQMSPPGRTEGYIPAAAGNTAPVGQGGISNVLDLGESAIHGLIDTGAQVASMAVSAAAAAGSFGAGAAAGPAASTAINMGADAAKRGVSYLYDLGGIWSEAVVEQLFPFGAPRWLGSADPMAFTPQIPGMGEQGKKAPGTMGAAASSAASWAQPGNPAMAAAGTPPQAAKAAFNAAAGPSAGAHGVAGPGAPPTPAPTGPPPGPPPAAPNPNDPSTWLNFSGIFDQGGVLQPQSIGVNLSKKPEYVMTQSQMAGMQKTAAAGAQSGRGGDTNTFYGQDNDEMFRAWEKQKRRESRQYSGRP